MRKLALSLLVFLSLLGCGTVQQTTGGNPPIVITDCSRQLDSLYNSIVDSFSRIVRPPVVDSVSYPVHDTLRIPVLVRDTTTQTIVLTRDTSSQWVIWLTAISFGDNEPQIKAAIDYCNTYPGWKLGLRHGLFETYSSIIAANLVNCTYKQVSFEMFGEFGAKNAPDQFLSIIAPQFWTTPALAIQQGKGVKIRNITLLGGYQLPSHLIPAQVFSYRPAQWQDGVCSFGRTNPYAGIAIDPFSDSTYYGGMYQMYDRLHQWYIPGMSRGGSTDIKIVDCKITQFVVCIVVTPSFQQNGELIDVLDCQLGNCYSAYAWTQAQSKQNNVKGLMVWSACYVVFDGVNYGYQHGDGTFAPTVDDVNIAGEVNSLIQAYAYSFAIKLSNVYGEEIFRIGSTGANSYSPTVFENCTFDWASSQDNMYSPDFLFEGDGVIFRDCHFRNYNQDTLRRFVLNSTHTIFDGGDMGLVPYIQNDQNDPPEMHNVMVFYGRTPWIKTNRYDTSYIISQGAYHATGNGNGYFVGGNLSTLKQGDLLITTATNVNGEVPGIQAASVNHQTILGYVTYPITSDTVFVDHSAVSILDNTTYPIFVCKYKKSFQLQKRSLRRVSLPLGPVDSVLGYLRTGPVTTNKHK